MAGLDPPGPPGQSNLLSYYIPLSSGLVPITGNVSSIFLGFSTNSALDLSYIPDQYSMLSPGSSPLRVAVFKTTCSLMANILPGEIPDVIFNLYVQNDQGDYMVMDTLTVHPILVGSNRYIDYAESNLGFIVNSQSRLAVEVSSQISLDFAWVAFNAGVGFDDNF